MPRIEVSVLKSSYSGIGPHRAYINDDASVTFFHFSDDGGLFGQNKKLGLSVSQFLECADHLICVRGEKPFTIFGNLTLSDGSVCFKCVGTGVETVLLRLIDAAGKYRMFSRLYFPLKLTRANAERAKAALFPPDAGEPELFPHWEPTGIIRSGLEEEGWVPAQVASVEGRLRIHALFFEDEADLPVDKAIATIDGCNIRFENRMLLAGLTLDGAQLCVPSTEVATAFTAYLGLDPTRAASATPPVREGGAGLLSQTHIHGYVNGTKILSEICDAELLGTALVLHLPDGEKGEVRFEFSSDALAIDGTSDSFIISDSDQTILQLMPQSETFHRAVLDSLAVQRTAMRAANRGPFIGVLDGTEEFIRFAPAGGGGPVLTRAGRMESVTFAFPVEPRLTYSDGRHVLEAGSLRIRAELPMLEGFAASLHAIDMDCDVGRDFQECLTLVLALEGDYLGYTVFGNLVAVHLGLVSALGMENHDHVSFLQTEHERNTFLLYMNESVPTLAKGIETAIHYLPAFCARQDAEFLRPLGLQHGLHAGNVEQACQRALGGATALLPHLFRMDAALSRLATLQAGVASRGGWGKYVPLGVSAAASFVNPFALIGVAQQGASLMTASSAQAAMSQENQADIFLTCAREWDYLVHTLLPAVSHRLASEMYPIRLAVSAILGSAYEKPAPHRQELSRALRERLARLMQFKKFPTTVNPSTTRAACMAFLMAAQQDADEFLFRHF